MTMLPEDLQQNKIGFFMWRITVCTIESIFPTGQSPAMERFPPFTPIMSTTATDRLILHTKAHTVVTEAEFVDVIGTKKSLKSFSSCYSQSPHLYLRILLPLTSLSKSGLKLVCNVNIV
jgi:hypothetical protein